MSNLYTPYEAPPWPLIYAKLAAVMAELPAVGKDSINQQQGWNFRGVDAVVNAISPALRKHGVIVVPQMTEATYRDTMTTGGTPRPTREVTVRVAYMFYAEDGSHVTAIVPGESLDQSDKGSAKAMSVAFRIALLQVFALPTSEPDPDASYHTRDGVGSMAATVATMMAQLLPNATSGDLVQYWPVVLEHSAAERAMVGSPDSPTWAQAFTARFEQLIDQIETWAQGSALLADVRAAGFEQRVGAKLRARADYIKARRQEAFDASMLAITTATTPEGLEAATVAAGDLLDKGILSESQASDLHTVAHERGQKLARELNQPAENVDDLAQAAADHIVDH
jgi:hypothetical protein